MAQAGTVRRRWPIVAAGILAAAVVAGCLGGGDGSDDADDGDGTGPPSADPDGPPAVTLVEVATGLEGPTFLTHAGDGTGDLYFLLQPGRVMRLPGGAGPPVVAADLTDRVGSQGSEQGLLGLAFAPGFPEPPIAFVDYTDAGGTTVVSQFDVGADRTWDTGSEQALLTVEQPFANHNGGMLAFGPDGHLYIALGDGGLAGDPRANGQNPATLLGSLLRVAPDYEGGYTVPPDNPFADDPLFAPEVWAYGLRNPWRFSFDRATGDLWIADVGQDEIEEIDFLPAAGDGAAPAGGANFGWNPYEGTYLYPAGIELTVLDKLFTFPVAQYGHDEGCSVTGGYVVRDPALAGFAGHYVYGDYCTGTVWHLDGPASSPEVLLQTGHAIASFGEDEEGRVYLVDLQGQVLRLEAAA